MNENRVHMDPISLSKQKSFNQPSTNTGNFECTITSWVSLPSNIPLIPVRLCEAITITSAFDFLAPSKIPSDKLELEICSVFALLLAPSAAVDFLN